MDSYDIAVIGSGPAGYVAAIRASQIGFKTACIEKESALGGTCLRVGCIPSKTLLQSSEHYELVKLHSELYGFTTTGLKLQFDKLMQKKDEVVKGLCDGIAGLFKKNHITPIYGSASFTDPNTLSIQSQSGARKISAKTILLATGSEPIAIPFLPFDEEHIVSSTGALSLKKVPKKMLVIGAGVIGVELASVYRRLGADVVVIEMLDHIIPGMDRAVCKSFLQILKKQGLTFHLSAKVTGGKVTKDKVEITADIASKQEKFNVDVCLVAVGRRPYTKGLGLESIGINVDKQGFVPVDSAFRTSIPHILAIGDIIRGPMLAHRASEEAVAAVDSLTKKPSHINYMAIPNVIYTHPEVASCGLTESEAKEAGRNTFIGMSYFKGNPRARCASDTDGFVKIVGDKKTGRLLGVHIIGPRASELIAEGVMALEKRATVQEVASASHAHPTLSEAIKEAALDSLNKPIHQ